MGAFERRHLESREAAVRSPGATRPTRAMAGFHRWAEDNHFSVVEGSEAWSSPVYERTFGNLRVAISPVPTLDSHSSTIERFLVDLNNIDTEQRSALNVAPDMAQLQKLVDLQSCLEG